MVFVSFRYRLSKKWYKYLIPVLEKSCFENLYSQKISIWSYIQSYKRTTLQSHKFANFFRGVFRTQSNIYDEALFWKWLKAFSRKLSGKKSSLRDVWQVRKYVSDFRGHPFSTYTKVTEDLTFLAPDTYMCMCVSEGKKCWFLVKFCLRNKWMTFFSKRITLFQTNFRGIFRNSMSFPVTFLLCIFSMNWRGKIVSYYKLLVKISIFV